MAALIPFRTMLARAREGRAEVTSDWLQGRVAFGGLTVGYLVDAMAHNVDRDRPIRSVLTNFIGPVHPGPVTIETRALRRGRSIEQHEARLLQEGECKLLCQGIFGQARRSALGFAPPPPPPMGRPEDAPPLPYIEGAVPQFTQHLDYRFVLGALPFSGAPVTDAPSELGGYFRFRADQGWASPAVLAALVDAWPCPALQHLSAPAPASSLSWMLDFIAPPEATTTEWWRYRAVNTAADDGFVQAEAMLWTEDGRPVAVSRQSYAIFDRPR